MTCRAFPSEQFSLDGIQKPQTGKMNTFNTFLHAFLSDVLELNIVSHSGETPDNVLTSCGMVPFNIIHHILPAKTSHMNSCVKLLLVKYDE